MIPQVNPHHNVVTPNRKAIPGGSNTVRSSSPLLSKLEAATTSDVNNLDTMKVDLTNFSERTRRAISFARKRRDAMKDPSFIRPDRRGRVYRQEDEETQVVSNCGYAKPVNKNARAEDEETCLVSNRTRERSPTSVITPTDGHRRVHFEAKDEFDWRKGVKEHIIGERLKPSSEMSKKEKEEIWWTESDYESFQKNVTDTTSVLNRSSEVLPGSYSTTLKKVYQACRSNASRSHGHKQVLSFRERLELVSWTRVAISRRGLEYHSIPFLLEALQDNREATTAVVGLQEKLEKASIFDTDLRSDTLRVYSEKRTLPAKLFAQILAQADAEALVEPSAAVDKESTVDVTVATRRLTM